MEDIFFLADTHFNHIMMAENRGFASVEEMNEIIIETWNRNIKPKDRVYFLGDFALGSQTKIGQIIDRLNGGIRICLGNHDKLNVLNKSKFVWVKDYFKMKDGDNRIILSHYPFEVWDRHAHGSLMLHGHTHSNLPQTRRKRQDVGWDVFKRPVNLEEIHLIMQERIVDKIDHNTSFAGIP